MKRPLAYLTAAWSGEPDVDMELAAHYCRLAYEAGFSPICPLLYLPLFLNDSVPEEHKAGIDMRRDMLRRSHTLIVCGSVVDEDVKNDIAVAGRLGIVSPLGILVLLYLAFICGAGYVLWALLMKNNPVSRIAIFGFVNPVVNVLLSAVLNGEPLFRWQYLAALVFVCVGIWLVNKAPAQKEKV